MADREKILRYFRASEDGELAARLLDLAEGARRSGKFRVTEFLDPHGLSVAEVVAANFEGLRLEEDGGFCHAERVRAAFVADEFGGQPDFGLVCLELVWDKRFYELGHRDVLGAFTGTGCKRSSLGDIVFTDAGAQLVADRVLADFLLVNFTAVGGATVSVSEIGRESLQQREEKVKEISATVADLRLDAVAAAGYGISRSRMAEEIKGQNVKLNWQVARKAAQPVVEGDVISFRGRGRVEVAEVRGTTKKGRTGLLLKRFV